MRVSADQDGMQWLIGTLVVVFLAFAGALIKLYDRISEVADDADKQVTEAKKEANSGDTALWTAHNQHVTSVANYREAIAERLGNVAKKSDIEAFAQEVRARDERIMAAISNITSGRPQSERNSH
jgi:hypothetical protein